MLAEIIIDISTLIPSLFKKKPHKLTIIVFHIIWQEIPWRTIKPPAITNLPIAEDLKDLHGVFKRANSHTRISETYLS